MAYRLIWSDSFRLIKWFKTVSARITAVDYPLSSVFPLGCYLQFLLVGCRLVDNSKPSHWCTKSSNFHVKWINLSVSVIVDLLLQTASFISFVQSFDILSLQWKLWEKWHSKTWSEGVYALARFIGFVPIEYNKYKALRVEVYGVLLSTGTDYIFSVPYHWNPTSGNIMTYLT